MEEKKSYVITFGDLKIGIHEFEFTIKESFFESFPELECKKGNVKIHIELIKKERMLTLNF
ncbi:MAG: DUF177 domain-containing protein, partial [Bacteroidota bacterium]|nr:DUF177 domain-containing protein [Bacteroidota bacterium]